MLTECRHVLSSGRKCKAPALRHSSFCYFHRNMREKRDAPRSLPGAAFTLPTLEDPHSLLNALNAVCAAMSCGQIKRSEAGAYLSAVNIAARLIARIPKENDDVEPVRTLEYDNYGAEMAEDADFCEPPEDCPECQSRSVCEVYEMARTDPYTILPNRVPITKQVPADRECSAECDTHSSSERDLPRPLHESAADNAFGNSIGAGSLAPGCKMPPQSEPSTQLRKPGPPQNNSADSCP